jgi:hypothetical protein
VNKDAISELLRNLPRNKPYLISQGNTTHTMNDKVRNGIVHQLTAHQSISETSIENWMGSVVSGGAPFTISEHTYIKPGGYAFFNYLFKEEIDDELVKLFQPFQIFKQLPDFTKYTDKGVDNETHFGEHYCCLIQALIEQGCDGSVLLEARTCITGLFVPKSALKQFCDIAKIRIKLFWYENRTMGERKQLNGMKTVMI